MHSIDRSGTNVPHKYVPRLVYHVALEGQKKLKFDCIFNFNTLQWRHQVA